MQTFPTQPGFHKIDVDAYLEALYEMDTEIFAATSHSFPFDSKHDLYNYIAIEHTTDVFIFVAEAGETVGYMSIEQSTDVSRMTELIHIGIRPKFQQQGFGSKLMQEFIRIVGSNAARLVTHPDNESTKLYSNFGFVPIKVIENYFGDGEPRLLCYRPSEQ